MLSAVLPQLDGFWYLNSLGYFYVWPGNNLKRNELINHILSGTCSRDLHVSYTNPLGTLGKHYSSYILPLVLVPS